MASAASLGHERLLAVVRDSRFARYCEENTLADAFFSKRAHIHNKKNNKSSLITEKLVVFNLFVKSYF